MSTGMFTRKKLRDAADDLEWENGFAVFAVDDLRDGTVEGTGTTEDADDPGNHRDLFVLQKIAQGQ